jgi:ABC transport system ATP-binding/permease protein
VLIARLMLQPADLLLLDEPTNDLDIPTLEVLEESLTDFPGALALVTHDRYMLDRVSTAVLGLDGEGGAALYADYSQWEQARTPQPRARREPAAARTREPEPAKKRLSYLEQREWDVMEEKILQAESALAGRQGELDAAMAAGDATRLHTAYDKFLAAQQEVEALYQRWSELENKLA